MEGWNRRSFILATGAATAVTAAQGADTQSPAKQPDPQGLIDEERQRIVAAMAREDIPGVAVCLIQDGKACWSEGFGVTDRRSKRRVDVDTIFSIQSTSKNFTATGVMLAVQQGLVDLDRPIASYLPNFTVHSRFEAAPASKMTLRLLLGHRAGFTHEAPAGNNYDPAFENFDAHVRSISQTWLRFKVGERYRYSNLGIDLAGYIVQVASGVPFSRWLEEALFQPLGMKDSTVDTETYAARKNRALGHDRGYDRVPLRTPLIPSGGVYTSARDLSRYCRFHLGRGQVDGKTVLKESLWNEMHAFPFGGDFGLGVIRKELRHGTTNLRLLSHQGGGFGFGCVFYYCPEASLAWAAMFNRPVSAAYGFGSRLIDQALVQTFGPGQPRLPIEDLAAIELPKAVQQKYVGTYVGRNLAVEIKSQDGKLGMQTGTTFSAIRATQPDELHVAGADGRAISYRWLPASELAPAHLECSEGERSLDYNDGPNDVAGPNRPEWARYLGSYRIEQWGKPVDRIDVQLKNGYLYFNQTRLVNEQEAGLFFTADGEAVDFRPDVPTWRNIRLHRI